MGYTGLTSDKPAWADSGLSDGPPKSPWDALQRCRELRSAKVYKEAETLCSRMLIRLTTKDSSDCAAQRLQIELLLERAHCLTATNSWARMLIDCRSGFDILCKHIGLQDGFSAADAVPKVSPKEQPSVKETLDVGWAQRVSLALAGLEVQGTWKLKKGKAFHVAIGRALNICAHCRPSTLYEADVFQMLPSFLKEALATNLPCVNSCLEHAFLFLLEVTERLGKFLELPKGLDLLLSAAAKDHSVCQPLALRSLIIGLSLNEDVFVAKPSIPFFSAVLHSWCDSDDRPFLYTRFLLEAAGRPSVRTRIKITKEAREALLSVIMRAPGAPTFAAALLLVQLRGQDLRGLNPDGVRGAVLEICRRVCEARNSVAGKQMDFDNAFSLDCLALVHLRPLLSPQRLDQEEPASRGVRFQCLWKSGPLAKSTQESSSMLHIARALLHTVASANAPSLPSAVPGLRWPPMPEDVLIAGIPWVEEACSMVASRKLLLAWVMDLASAESHGLLQGQPTAPGVLLTFVEAELSSLGGLECLHCLVARCSPMRAEAAKRPRLIEKLFACCDGRDTVARCYDAGACVSISCTGSERMDACRALMSLMEEPSAADAWAPCLVMLHGPSRAFRWMADGTVDAATIYALVRRMVESGGAAIAREAWHLCRRTLETPATLQIALDMKVPLSSSAQNAGVSPDEQEQWRLLLLTVLRVAADGAELNTWAGTVEPQQLLSAVQFSCGDDATALETCSALARLSTEALKASTAEAPYWPVPAHLREATKAVSKVKPRLPDRMDVASGSAAGVAAAHQHQWLKEHVLAHQHERTMPCGIVCKDEPGSEPMIIDGPLHKRYHAVGKGRGAMPHFMVSLPTGSPGKWKLDPHLQEQLNENGHCAPLGQRKSYGIHH